MGDRAALAAGGNGTLIAQHGATSLPAVCQLEWTCPLGHACDPNRQTKVHLCLFVGVFSLHARVGAWPHAVGAALFVRPLCTGAVRRWILRGEWHVHVVPGWKVQRHCRRAGLRGLPLQGAVLSGGSKVTSSVYSVQGKLQNVSIRLRGWGPRDHCVRQFLPCRSLVRPDCGRHGMRSGSVHQLQLRLS